MPFLPIVPLPVAAARPERPFDLAERLALVAHMQRCAAQRGRWFVLRCAVDALHAAVLPRFVTSLVVVFALFGAISLAL